MTDRLGIVLAAGQGTRMQSDLPKVLYPILGRPMIEYVLDALEQVAVRRVLVVVGYRSDLVRAALAHRPALEYVQQREQRGTGHAVQTCGPQLAEHDGPVVIVTGDSPLLQPSSLNRLFAVYDQQRPACVMGTLHKANPSGLGRIVRDERGQFEAIVEHRDASAEQLRITEVNMSTYVFDAAQLVWALEKLTNRNRQSEYYLTDCPGILRAAGRDVRAMAVLEDCEALSVNTVEEAAAVAARMQAMGSQRCEN